MASKKRPRKSTRRRKADATPPTRKHTKPSPKAKTSTRVTLAAFSPPPPPFGPASSLAAGGGGGGGETPSAKLGFAAFMGEVAEAMISAQQNLDMQTEAYLSGSSSPRPLPTMFRLPKLNAKMKFALEKKAGEKLNLLFYSATNTASALQQHSIDFDIVAVPPPPEAKLPPGIFIPLMPRIELVFDKARRRAWLETLLANAEAAAALDLQLATDPEKLSTVILWQFVLPVVPNMANDPPEIFPTLLLAANCSGPTAARVARLCFCVLGADGTKVVSTQPLPVEKTEVKTALATFVSRAGSRQTELLEPKPG